MIYYVLEAGIYNESTRPARRLFQVNRHVAVSPVSTVDLFSSMTYL